MNLYPHMNLLEMSNKKGHRDKGSYSASMKRLAVNPPLNSLKLQSKETTDYFNNIRREPDMSTNANSMNENTLQIMVKQYQNKEKSWEKDRIILENEIS